MPKLRLLCTSILFALTLHLAAQNDSAAWFVQAAAVPTTAEAEQAEAKLLDNGFKAVRFTQSSDAMIHLRVGPFSTQAQARAIHERLRSLGYSAVLLPPSASTASTGLTKEQLDLEAQALAKPGGSNAPSQLSSNADLEAQALAKLGGNDQPPAASGADLEAQAVRAMEIHTAQNEVEAAKRKVEMEEQERRNREAEALRAQQQAEMEQQQAAVAQQQASQPRAAGIFNGIASVLGAFNNAMAAQMPPSNGIQDTLNQGFAKINDTYARDQQLKAQQEAQQALQRAQEALQQAQREEAQEQAAQAPSSQSAPNTGRCPNGQYVDSAVNCDCRRNSAAYACFSSVSGSSSGTVASRGSETSNGTVLQENGTRAGNGAIRQSNGSGFSYTPPQPNQGAQSNAPASSSSNIQQPLPCYDLGPVVGCVSQATWQQIQNAPDSITPPTNTPTGPPQVYSIVNADIPNGPGVHWCPKSGVIHTGYYTANDVWIGQTDRCTVGFHVRVTWPALPGGSSTFGTTTTSGNNGGMNGGTDSGSNSNNASRYTTPCTGVVGNWVQDKLDPSKKDLWLNSICAEKVHVIWYLGNQAGSGDYIEAFGKINAYQSVKRGDGEQLSIYACPMDYPFPVQANGKPISGHGEQYKCAK